MNVPLVILAFALTLLFVLLAFFKPKAGLYMLLITRPVIDQADTLRTASLPGTGVTALQFIGLILPFALLASCVFRRANLSNEPVYFFKYRVANLYLLFLVLCLPGVLFSPQFFDSMTEWLRLCILWTVIIYAVNYTHTRKDIKQLWIVIVIASFYPLAFFAFDFLTGNQVMMARHLRFLAGYFHQSIISATLFCIAPAYVYFVIRTKNNLGRALALAGLLALVSSIYATHYRTSLLGFSVFLIFLLLFRRKYVVLLAFLIVAVTTSILNQDINQRFAPLLQALSNAGDLFSPRSTSSDVLLSGRFGLWRELITTFPDSPLTNMVFGFGYQLPVRGLETVSTHSDVLSLLYRYGFISCVAFYAFFFHVIRSGLKSISHLTPQLIISFALGLLVISMGHVTFSDVRNMLFLGVYIAMLYRYPAAAERGEQPAPSPLDSSSTASGRL